MSQADPICGHCGKPLSAHYHEDYYGEKRIYCFENTTGDLFDTEPSHDNLGYFLAYHYPKIHAALVRRWKKENGHV